MNISFNTIIPSVVSDTASVCALRSVTVQYSCSKERSGKMCTMLRSNKSFSVLRFELKLISYSAFLTLDLLAPCNSNIGVLESSRAFMLKRSQPHYLSSLSPYWWWRHTAEALCSEDGPVDHGSSWEAFWTLHLFPTLSCRSIHQSINPSKVSSAADCVLYGHYLMNRVKGLGFIQHFIIRFWSSVTRESHHHVVIV